MKDYIAILIYFAILLVLALYITAKFKNRRSKTIGKFISSFIEIATQKNNSLIKKKGIKMEQTNLVMGERVRDVVQFSDVNNNARKVEDVRLTFDSTLLNSEIVEVREWTSDDGSVGTEVEVLSTPVIEGSDTLGIEGDPLPGDPQGLVRLEKQIVTSSAASHGSFVSSVIEAA